MPFCPCLHEVPWRALGYELPGRCDSSRGYGQLTCCDCAGDTPSASALPAPRARLLYLFSGKDRLGSFQSHLRRLASSFGQDVEICCVDSVSRGSLPGLLGPKWPLQLHSQLSTLSAALPAIHAKRWHAGPIKAGCDREHQGRFGLVQGERHLSREARRKRGTSAVRRGTGAPQPQGEEQKCGAPKGEAQPGKIFGGAYRTRGPIFACSATSIRKQVQHTFYCRRSQFGPKGQQECCTLYKVH